MWHAGAGRSPRVKIFDPPARLQELEEADARRRAPVEPAAVPARI